jgi:adenosylcobinamide-GDP ribazoletransferase
VDGLWLALSWLTVLPAPAQAVDARSCRRAIALAPMVGCLVGGVGALALWALTAVHAPTLLAGLLTVAVFVLFTRGMHVDGLADTVDGLGCYGPPERALNVMRDGSAGPFAVVALFLVLGVQTVALARLATTANWQAVVLACAVGRAAFVLCCHRGIPAARQDGMGYLVAGSQPTPIVAAWWLVLALAGGAGVRGIWWQGVVAVVVGGAATLVLLRHARRRFGGITGDVLGAAGELATTLVLAVCSLG